MRGDPRDTPTLIAHIVDHFHEGHRRDLPGLIALARTHAPGVADHLAAMATALEHHMFKEEARLFPMMEQGGNALLGMLIDDIEAEHRAHEEALARLVDLAGEAGCAALMAPLRHFIDELEAHVTIEDEVLFPRFERRAVRPAW